jgi:catalase
MNTPGEQAPQAGLSLDDLARQIFEVMLKLAGDRPGFRVVHAKGIVCQGTFTPSRDASAISKAAHFQGASVPVTVRFSDGSSDPTLPENSPDAGPRGMAIRFKLPDGSGTDIVSLSHNGFVVGTEQQFLELQKAVAATDPTKPHPWPIEAFLGAHPLALKFVVENRVVPASFATESFFSSDVFVFVNKSGVRQPVRYQLLPVAGKRDLNDEEAKAKPANFLVDELRTRLAAGPVQFRFVVQLPNPGDPTRDPSFVWPDDRKTMEVGTISIISVVADSAGAERELAFFPTNLTDGIELSDDPFPDLRSRVYGLASAHRHKSRIGA